MMNPDFVMGKCISVCFIMCHTSSLKNKARSTGQRNILVPNQINVILLFLVVSTFISLCLLQCVGKTLKQIPCCHNKKKIADH